MKIKREYRNFDGWQDRILWLWEEDDARPVDRERPPEALQRLSNRKTHTQVDIVDAGEDYILRLYQGGWVSGLFPEGGAVGVVYHVDG